MTDVKDEALEAVKHYVEQIYEATRWLHAAYQVDTGDQLDVVIPPWGELTEDKRQLFMRESHLAVDILTMALFVGARGEG